MAYATAPVRRALRCALCGALLAFFAGAGIAAEPPTQLRPQAPAVRIDAADAPLIDGDISDPVWSRATVIEDFRQVDPDSGQPATERTVLRILYDQDNLYFAVYCYDSGPVTLGTRARDSDMGTGDLVRIFLDPTRTRRNAYSFEVGSSGARRDALVQNNADFFPQWDTLWQGRTRLVADGWTVEIAIPFRSVSYDRDSAEWGFDFTRAIRRREERVRWTSYSAAINVLDVSQSGSLTGISELREGLGLDVQLYGRATVKRDWPGRDRTALSGAAGGNAYYRITTGLTGTLTANPDFSDTPLDVRQVNLSRFSLFLPETRDFFLQDAQAFEFGGRNFLSPNARPFFSRNIGLVNGTPVSIIAGGKLSGEEDGFGIGALSVRTDRKGSTPGQMLSAARVNRPVLSESRVGVIFTNGDPTGATRNTVAGGDFQYRDSHFLGSKIVQADLYYERSFSSAVGEDDSFGIAGNFPNEPWGAAFRLRQVGERFAPALGFVNQPGIRVYGVDATHVDRFPDAYLRVLRIGANAQLITDLHERLQSRNIGMFMNGNTEHGDFFEVAIRNFAEDVPATFTLASTVPVRPARYHWNTVQARVNLTRARRISTEVFVECCSFYDGEFVRTELGLFLRPHDILEFAFRYSATFITLPTGYVAIHVPTADVAVNFTPDMQLAIQGQFDNISRQVAFSARYRWEYALGNELFAAFGQSGLVPESSFDPQISQFSVRLGHTLRF